MNTDFPQYPHYFPGSASAISVGGRYFLFCCGHQLKHSRPDQTAFRPEGSKVTAAPSHLLRPNKPSNIEDRDLFDMAAFEYVMENYNYANLASEFFTVNDDAIWPENAIDRFCAIGFPDDSQSISYDEPRVSAHRQIVGGKYDGTTSELHLHRLKLDHNISSKGMSGGPVFYTGRIGVSFFIGWAGMIMRGGSNSEYLHFITAQHLIEVVLHYPISQ